MSKGLEAFKEIREYLDYVLYGIAGTKAISFTSTSMYLEPFMTNIERELKALEIIKEKKVDVKYLCYRAEFNVEKYNDNYIETLTQEECDLLREVLK